MKTAEQEVAEILKEGITFSGQLGDYVIHGAIDKLIEWRQLYSDQQNKELREENGELKASLNTFAASVDFAQAEIVKLKRLLKEIEQALADGHYDINDSWLPSELCRKITTGIEGGLQLDPDTEAEIQRLTKEVEELKQQVTPSGILQAKTNKELTRLRELLGETLKWLQWSSHSDAQLLATKIDNALNHKP